MDKLTIGARGELKGLATDLKLSAKEGVTNMELAVKAYRSNLIAAGQYDMKFSKSEAYTALEKHFSTFRLPKANELKDYVEKALAIIEPLLKES